MTERYHPPESRSDESKAREVPRPKLVCRQCGATVGAGTHRLFCPKFLTPGPVMPDADAVCAACGFNWSPWCCENARKRGLRVPWWTQRGEP